MKRVFLTDQDYHIYKYLTYSLANLNFKIFQRIFPTSSPPAYGTPPPPPPAHPHPTPRNPTPPQPYN